MQNEQDMAMTMEAVPQPQLERALHDGPMSPKEYTPTQEELVRMNKEALREWEISIKFLNRGCVVCVGCKQIPFESVDNAMKAINDYVANPWEQQKIWRNILD